MTWKKLAYADDVVDAADFTAKGMLLAGTGVGAFAGLAVGANGLALVAASGETTGLIWAAPAPAAHATSHKTGGSDTLRLNEFTVPNAAVPFSGQQATNFVIHQVADATALAALTAVVGKLAFQVDELAVYICTAV